MRTRASAGQRVLLTPIIRSLSYCLAAVMAGEEGMINDFYAGTDIHTKTAAEVYHVPLDDVTKAQRRRQGGEFRRALRHEPARTCGR